MTGTYERIQRLIHSRSRLLLLGNKSVCDQSLQLINSTEDRTRVNFDRNAALAHHFISHHNGWFFRNVMQHGTVDVVLDCTLFISHKPRTKTRDPLPNFFCRRCRRGSWKRSRNFKRRKRRSRRQRRLYNGGTGSVHGLVELEFADIGSHGVGRGRRRMEWVL